MQRLSIARSLRLALVAMTLALALVAALGVEVETRPVALRNLHLGQRRGRRDRARVDHRTLTAAAPREDEQTRGQRARGTVELSAPYPGQAHGAMVATGLTVLRRLGEPLGTITRGPS